jgi:hypothetical protein
MTNEETAAAARRLIEGELPDVGAALAAVSKARARLAHSRSLAAQTIDSVRRELRATASTLAVALPGPAERLLDAVSALPADPEDPAAGAAFRQVVSDYASLAEEATRLLFRSGDNHAL